VQPSPLPLLLAGPMLRHVSANEFTIWLVTSASCQSDIALYLVAEQDYTPLSLNKDDTYKHSQYQVGTHAFIHLLHIHQTELLAPDTQYAYDVALLPHPTKDQVKPPLESSISIAQLRPDLHYAGQQYFHFHVPDQLRNVLHGSCRKPHHPNTDALPQLDKLIKAGISEPSKAPDVVFFTGDQIYADDVSGPMLQAVHQVVAKLGLWDETFDGTSIHSASELLTQPDTFYQREQLLPDTEANEELIDSLFKGKRKPIFTSVNAQNHLMSFAEIIGMYLLTWSDALWQITELSNAQLSPKAADLFAQEQPIIEDFVSTLPAVQRALAHVPNYYIFDDHDVTDDWNLTRAWEEDVYSHPFSKRIIGNALIGYWLCQGLGNQPLTTDSLCLNTLAHFTPDGIRQHDELCNTLFAWQKWHYQLDTHPPVRVLDTRTRRWRSESSATKPSGLMDWESLVEFQQSILGEKDVIVVSAAPIYGVKLIEAIQRFFTLIGQALMVDAENWMAHKGTANVMLNIFKHARTPPRFIILSGDVHYSFVYDVRLRFKKHSPQILQFTCSGLKNAFPTKLISKLDTLNQWLYSTKSPLNMLTKRRDMKVIAREPSGYKGKELLNIPALGWLELDPEIHASNDTTVCSIVTNQGDKITFKAD
jgi:hypothetical protein